MKRAPISCKSERKSQSDSLPYALFGPICFGTLTGMVMLCAAEKCKPLCLSTTVTLNSARSS